MKNLIKLAAIALLGLSLLSATASAQQPQHSVTGSAGGGGGGFYDGMDPSVPAGATVGWYAYAYGAADASIEIGGVFTLQTYAPSNGSTSSSGTVSGAGILSARIYGQSSYGGAAGANVTVYW